MKINWRRGGVDAGRLNILQVNTADGRGGAAQVAWNLHRAYLDMGHGAWMAVGRKVSADPRVFAVPRVPAGRGRPPLMRALLGAARGLERFSGRGFGAGALSRALSGLACPQGADDAPYREAGLCQPGTWRLADGLPARPDVVHCHNLHGGYFDIRALPGLSREFPVVITMHDAWLTTGHCAHSMGCGRWLEGCGDCPDLGINPPVPTDTTAFQWKVKQDVFRDCRIFLAAPSRWLMGLAERSMLMPGVVETRVIPNGVDLAVFRPGDRDAARDALGIPRGARVVLFAANGIRDGMFKDFRTLRDAVSRTADALGGKVLFIALGEDGPDEEVGRAAVRFVPYTEDRGRVAGYYRAADVYAHAARADTFPNTVIEALACGTPVVATAVGGIPEQVRGLGDDEPDATGVLVPEGDDDALAGGLAMLLGDGGLRRRLGENAARDAAARFGLDRQAGDCIGFYETAIARSG